MNHFLNYQYDFWMLILKIEKINEINELYY